MKKLNWQATAMILLTLTATTTLSGARQADAPKQPQAFRDLLECRQIADPQARLACFDKQTAVLADADAKHQIVVADKAEVQRTQRGLFGFALPSSTILGSDGSQEQVKRLDTTVVSARLGRDGGWIVALSEGGTWQQMDSRELPLSPKPGQKVVITRGALGSYLVSVDGQPAMKMRRIQ